MYRQVILKASEILK